MKTDFNLCPNCGMVLTGEITIGKFVEAYGLRKDALVKFGLTYFIQRKYKKTPLADLPGKVRIKLNNALHAYRVML
jgi:hypothetical protein